MPKRLDAAMYKSKKSNYTEKTVMETKLKDHKDRVRFSVYGEPHKFHSMVREVEKIFRVERLRGRLSVNSPIEYLRAVHKLYTETMCLFEETMRVYKGIKTSRYKGPIFDDEGVNFLKTRLDMVHFLNCFRDIESRNKFADYLVKKKELYGDDMSNWRVDMIHDELDDDALDRFLRENSPLMANKKDRFNEVWD